MDTLMRNDAQTPPQSESMLERHFPHIALRLTDAWCSPEAADHFLSSLLVDDRDDRHGLPPEVFEELMFISDLNWKRRHFNDNGVEILPESFGFGSL